jgi:hypothetical protein
MSGSSSPKRRPRILFTQPEQSQPVDTLYPPYRYGVPMRVTA